MHPSCEVRFVCHRFPRTLLQVVLLLSHRGAQKLGLLVQTKLCYCLLMGGRLPVPSGGRASLVSHVSSFYLAGSDACSDERYFAG